MFQYSPILPLKSIPVDMSHGKKGFFSIGSVLNIIRGHPPVSSECQYYYSQLEKVGNFGVSCSNRIRNQVLYDNA